MSCFASRSNLVAFVALICLSSASVAAGEDNVVSSASAAERSDAWTIDISKQHPPVSAENRIIRWCSEDGSKHRYASANIDLKGYKPCGQLSSVVSCDPSGARVFSSSSQPPPGSRNYAHRDCSVGPRIKVVRHEPNPVTSSDFTGERSQVAADGSPPTGLSAAEYKRLERDFKVAQAEQERKNQKELEQVMSAMFGALSGGSGRGRDSRQRRGRDSQQLPPELAAMMKVLTAP